METTFVCCIEGLQLKGQGTQPRERIKALNEVLRKDMMNCGLSKNMVLDRVKRQSANS